jgi:acetyl-CoA carboxylase carboxyl transferase subunit alpha
MLEHSIYSVISPEGCASILWRDGEQAKVAAEALKITAQDLERLGIIDGIIPEPIGGAHRGQAAAFTAVRDTLEMHLGQLVRVDPGQLRARRRDKFLQMGRAGLSI